jgi:hypothetical protein
MPLVLGMSPLLWDRVRAFRARPLVLAGALVAPVLSLLVILPDIEGFLRSNLVFPVEVPLRTDVLSYPAMLVNELGVGGTRFAVVLGSGLAALVIAAMLARAPRTPAGFAAASAAAFLAFYAFNKYAALNYYFFVIAALCCAVAAAVESDEPAWS